jgi:hypothetical protein
MNWRKGAAALIGGALGFFVILVANAMAVRTAFQALGFFGSSPLTTGQALMIYLIAPLISIAGAALTALSLGATRWQSLLTGVAAFATAVSLLLAGRNNHLPFNQSEMFAFVCSAARTVFLSMLGKAGFDLTAFTVILGIMLLLVLAVSVFTGYGFVIALAAWLLLPAAAGLLRKPE